MTNMTNSTIITPRKTTIMTIFVKNESRDGQNRQFKSNLRYWGKKGNYIMKIFKYRNLPITFQLCREYEKGDFDIREFLAIRDNGIPVDRFDVFTCRSNRHYVAWTSDTCSQTIKDMRNMWAKQMNEACNYNKK